MNTNKKKLLRLAALFEETHHKFVNTWRAATEQTSVGINYHLKHSTSDETILLLDDDLNVSQLYQHVTACAHIFPCLVMFRDFRDAAANIFKTVKTNQTSSCSDTPRTYVINYCISNWFYQPSPFLKAVWIIIPRLSQVWLSTVETKNSKDAL